MIDLLGYFHRDAVSESLASFSRPGSRHRRHAQPPTMRARWPFDHTCPGRIWLAISCPGWLRYTCGQFHLDSHHVAGCFVLSSHHGAQMSSGDISYFNICNTLPVLRRYSCTLWDEVDESSIKNRGSVALALPVPSERFANFISLCVKAHMHDDDMLPPTAYSDLAAKLTTFFVRAVMWHCRPWALTGALRCSTQPHRYRM